MLLFGKLKGTGRQEEGKTGPGSEKEHWEETAQEAGHAMKEQSISKSQRQESSFFFFFKLCMMEPSAKCSFILSYLESYGWQIPPVQPFFYIAQKQW